MEIRREEIKDERNYNKYIDDVLDGNIKNIGGFFIPNSFQLDLVDEISKRGSIEGLEFYKKIYVKRRFSTISSEIWSSLAIYGKALLYDIVGFIANTINYDSNAVRIQYSAIRAFTNRNISNRDFISALSLLETKNIIMKSNKRGIYAVNPLMIYKGSIEKFAGAVTNSSFNKSIIIDNKLCIDKIMVYERKEDKDGVLIKNGKYYSKNNSITNDNKIEDVINEAVNNTIIDTDLQMRFRIDFSRKRK